MKKTGSFYTILGIDPGTRITGYGVIKTNFHETLLIDFGCIRPSLKEDLPNRYLMIHEAINTLISTHKPMATAIENQFVSKNAQSALKLGMAKGVAMLASTKNRIPVFEYAPKKAKQAIVGSGSASKTQVQRMIQMLLNLSKLPEPEDAADALALAMCHAHHLKFQLKVKHV